MDAKADGDLHTNRRTYRINAYIRIKTLYTKNDVQFESVVDIKIGIDMNMDVYNSEEVAEGRVLLVRETAETELLDGYVVENRYVSRESWDCSVGELFFFFCEFRQEWRWP